MPVKVLINFKEADKFQVDFLAAQVSSYIDKSHEGYVASGPNPLELFLSALGGCIAVYAKRYLTMHSIGFMKLEINASAEMSQDSPARLVNIKVTVTTDAKIDNREVFMRFIHNCPVHNTLLRTKEVSIELVNK